jgi:uncharacterized protein (TIGR03000 family)
MFRQRYSAGRILSLAVITLLATAALLATSGTALAQSDRVYSDATGYWRYYNGSWYHYKTYVHGYNPGYYARPDRVLPHGVSPGHYGAYSSPIRPTGPGYSYPWSVPTSARTQAESAATALPVHIEVRVPADADIWFDDAKTTQTGTVRQFVSPPLTPGYDYTYEIRARWTEEGRRVSHTRRVSVHAGERVRVTFPEAMPPQSNRVLSQEKGSVP